MMAFAWTLFHYGNSDFVLTGWGLVALFLFAGGTSVVVRR